MVRYLRTDKRGSHYPPRPERSRRGSGYQKVERELGLVRGTATSVRNEARSTPWTAGRKAGGLSSNLSLYFLLGLLLVPPFGETHAKVRREKGLLRQPRKANLQERRTGWKKVEGRSAEAEKSQPNWLNLEPPKFTG